MDLFISLIHYQLATTLNYTPSESKVLNIDIVATLNCKIYFNKWFGCLRIVVFPHSFVELLRGIINLCRCSIRTLNVKAAGGRCGTLSLFLKHHSQSKMFCIQFSLHVLNSLNISQVVLYLSAS